MKRATVDGLREKRELLPRASRHLYEVRLKRISKSRADQYFTALRMPVRWKRGSIFTIAAGGLRNRSRNLRHVLGNDILRRRDRRFLSLDRNDVAQKCREYQRKILPHEKLLPVP